MHVDDATQQRTAKSSYFWYRDWIAAHSPPAGLYPGAGGRTDVLLFWPYGSRAAFGAG